MRAKECHPIAAVPAHLGGPVAALSQAQRLNE
jgi:hypothetical protein